jgi:hypothetical protein
MGAKILYVIANLGNAVFDISSVLDLKTFFSDSDRQNFLSDSDTDSDSADIYFGTNNSKVFFQWPTNIF